MRNLNLQTLSVTQPIGSAASSVSLNSTTTMLAQIEQFLSERYLFRFNQLTGDTEFSPRTDEYPLFRQVTQRVLNTICIAAQREGIVCWDRDISRYIHSENVFGYHPFTAYMESLPVWDGADRILALAERVSENPLWVSGFHRWMLGMAAQWMQLDALHGNSVAPLLVSRKQGMHKSTFCKILLPNTLQSYYTDSFDLATADASARKLSEFGLINIDEFDKCAPQKMALLKNLMQMAQLNIRRAYQKSNSTLPRIASFIATSNRFDLLSDPTGSRRFLCVEVVAKIDTSAINHAQIYAQLKAELAQGMRCWFDTLEEKALMQNNKPFQCHAVEGEVFQSCFRLASADDATATVLKLNVSELFRRLKKFNPAAMKQSTLRGLSAALVRLDAVRTHTKYGNFYKVVLLHG